MKVGDTVYHYENWSRSVMRGVIKKISKYVKVEDDYVVNENGGEVCYCPGETYCKKEQLYSSAEAAYEEQLKAQQNKIKEYCDQIKSIEDLVKFSIDHCLNGEEYTDYEARRAYINRVSDLLGIKLED